MTEKSGKLGKSVPALADWPSGPSGWLHAFGSFDHAQAFSTLFWPGFITHDMIRSTNPDKPFAGR